MVTKHCLGLYIRQDSEMVDFPKDFLWGSSTAAHQVEGNNINNWSVWEKENAQRLASEFPNSFPLLRPNENLKVMGKDPSNYISGNAVDHYHRYEEDFDLLKSLGMNSYRFSIEWSRIQPKKGEIDRSEIAHYIEMIAQLRKRGIEPVVTLWHWTHPIWVEDEGGVLGKNFIKYFCEFVDLVTKEITEVRYWITINEPEVVSSLSFYSEEWPPQKKGFINLCRGYLRLMECHRKGYRTIKKNLPNSLVSFAHHRVVFEKGDNSFATTVTNFVYALLSNDMPFVLAGKIDYIALNHYGRSKLRGWGLNLVNENKVMSDLGWEVYPQSIYTALITLRKYQLPILITENGVADKEDRIRGWFLKEILNNVSRAIKNGTNVIGYLHWSLLDNFEWDKGYWPAFGLIEVERKTMKRKVRASAYVYSEIIRNGIKEGV